MVGRMQGIVDTRGPVSIMCFGVWGPPFASLVYLGATRLFCLGAPWGGVQYAEPEVPEWSPCNGGAPPAHATCGVVRPVGRVGADRYRLSC